MKNSKPKSSLNLSKPTLAGAKQPAAGVPEAKPAPAPPKTPILAPKLTPAPTKATAPSPKTVAVPAPAVAIRPASPKPVSVPSQAVAKAIVPEVKATIAPPKASAAKAKPAAPKAPAVVLETSPVPVPLVLRAPEAREVFVVGSFNDWDVGRTPLRPSPAGDWQGQIKLLPGRYEYLFVVDGHWLPDPAAQEMLPNPYGGQNSVLSVF